MPPPSSLDVLRSPLPPLNLADQHQFEQIQLRGITLAVDAVARERIAAAREIGKSGAAGVAAIPQLIEMMGQDRIAGSASAANVVAAFTGGSPTSADGHLAENMTYISEADLACHVVAQDALTSIGAPAVPALIESLRSPVANQKIGAAKALGTMGGVAQWALDALKALRNDSSENARKAAAEAIKTIKPKGWFSF